MGLRGIATRASSLAFLPLPKQLRRTSAPPVPDGVMFTRSESAATPARAGTVSASCQREAAFAEHNEWLRLQRESYAQRISCATESASEGRWSSFASEHTSGSRHAVLSGEHSHFSTEVDAALLTDDITGGHALTAGFGSLLLENDDFDEGPVYRSLTVAQPSGDHIAQLQEPPQSMGVPLQASVSETVDALWMQGTNPPLIRRQKAFPKKKKKKKKKKKS